MISQAVQRVIAAALFVQSGISQVTVRPSTQYSLSEKLNGTQWRALHVREMRSTPAGDMIWFLIQSKTDPASFGIVRTDPAGNVQQLVSLPRGHQAIGLAATRDGVATVLLKGGNAALTEYDLKGSVVLDVPVQCYAAEFLVAISGLPATICADGVIQRYSRSAPPTRTLSWARPGSQIAVLSDSKMAVIDRSSAQMLVNDTRTNDISVVANRGPEIDAALQSTNQIRQDAAKLPPASPPLGKPIVVMDTASDASGWYVLVYPYHPNSGPAITKFNNAGQLESRIRCQGPFVESSSLHQIEVQGGDLLLCSVAGTVYRYKLPVSAQCRT